MTFLQCLDKHLIYLTLIYTYYIDIQISASHNSFNTLDIIIIALHVNKCVILNPQMMVQYAYNYGNQKNISSVKL